MPLHFDICRSLSSTDLSRYPHKSMPADKPTSGLDSTVAPTSGLEPTIAPPHRKPSLETVGPTVAATAHDLAELPIVDAGLYSIGTEIGRGGMGRVIGARDR